MDGKEREEGRGKNEEERIRKGRVWVNQRLV